VFSFSLSRARALHFRRVSALFFCYCSDWLVSLHVKSTKIRTRRSLCYQQAHSLKSCASWGTIVLKLELELGVSLRGHGLIHPSDFYTNLNQVSGCETEQQRKTSWLWDLILSSRWPSHCRNLLLRHCHYSIEGVSRHSGEQKDWQASKPKTYSTEKD